ncbi:MAG: hypothetical protein ACLQU9_02345 [Acidimicrobiales bacterium]|jgi:hypothetical protein
MCFCAVSRLKTAGDDAPTLPAGRAEYQGGKAAGQESIHRIGGALVGYDGHFINLSLTVGIDTGPERFDALSGA